jgi:FMN phosphatase YigB (HAD superfamily)
MTSIVIFDLFNTLLDISEVPLGARRDYQRKIVGDNETIEDLEEGFESSKFFMPEDKLNKILEDIKNRFNVRISTFSNCPISLQKILLKNVPAIEVGIPLAELGTKKPRQNAYEEVPEWFGLPPEDILVVTANRKFGDLEGAASAGMKSLWIESGKISMVEDYLAQKL